MELYVAESEKVVLNLQLNAKVLEEAYQRGNRKMDTCSS